MENGRSFPELISSVANSCLLNETLDHIENASSGSLSKNQDVCVKLRGGERDVSTTTHVFSNYLDK